MNARYDYSYTKHIKETLVLQHHGIFLTDSEVPSRGDTVEELSLLPSLLGDQQSVKELTECTETKKLALVFRSFYVVI